MVESQPSGIGDSFVSYTPLYPFLILSPVNCPLGIDKSQIIREHERISFTYEVEFVKSDIRWPSRWDAFLKMEGARVHWFSILNSLMVITLLAGIVFVIFLRTVRRFDKLYVSGELSRELQKDGVTVRVQFPVFCTLISLVLHFCALTLIGGFIGTRPEAIQYPIRTNQIPREIPARKYPSWLLVLGAGTLPFGTLFIELFFILSSIWLGSFSNTLLYQLPGFDLQNLSGPVSAILYLGGARKECDISIHHVDLGKKLPLVDNRVTLSKTPSKSFKVAC
ncbi:hypothetical protein F3Y22_tig00111693pilonHSYRG00163 [Hibiscus syriacus]|uniref:Transmembrane 9 superfamily member n=1 Tax=Hibiscus syriacus TaxID=106335 RepID=A0A6A2YBK1_HIBSY|nr:hypothetical protein F3Y22_tig00111693pilonHSYRG00163 [Hibiscus syriacus]